MNERPSCSTCRWWDQAGAELSAGSIDPVAKPDLGVCCVDPPRLMSITPYWHVGQFPATHATRFCGAWEGSPGDDGTGERSPTDNVLAFNRGVA